jgi:hypothetical protein
VGSPAAAKPPDGPQISKLAPPGHPQMSRLATPAGSPRPKAPQVSSVFRARRDLLLAAVRARAMSLRPCVPGDATELRVPLRLHVLRNGPVKSVEFPGEPPARPLRDCVRRIATSWNFHDLALPSDVDLFATLALSPGA